MTQRTFTTLVGTLVRMDGGRTRRHLGALLAAGALSTAGLTACTGDDPPPPSSTTNSGPATTSPSAATTATPPAAPKAEPTAKSAEAFVKYFWEVYNYSYATLDSQILKSISAEQCKFCTSTRDDVDQLREAGTRIEGLTVHVASVAAPPVEDATRIAVVTVIRQDQGQSIKSDGSVQSLTGRSRTQSLAALEWVRGNWQIHGISIDAKGATP